METKPIAAEDAEQQWIAKYRQAIEANRILVRHSGSSRLSTCITETFEKLRSNVDGMIERCVRSQSRKDRAADKCCSGPKIDRAKLRLPAARYGMKVGESMREKAS